MLDGIQSILQQKCQIDQSKLILIGVSGGPDSLCMLDILHGLKQPIILAHFNHNLRPESGDDALQVKQVAQKLGVEFVIGEADVAGLAKTAHLSLEEAARISRYQWLFSQAEANGAQAVAVAHTADDQVETVFMHLLRGSGLSGLMGMPYYALPNPWSTTIPLIRPMLGTWRSEIEAYLSARGLEPVQDASNQDVKFFRNRLRHEFIPLLEQIKPESRQVILRMTQVLEAEDKILEALVEEAWQNCQTKVFQNSVVFEREGFLEQPLALKRRLLRKMIAQLRAGLLDIDFDTIEHAIEIVNQPPATAQANLAAGLTLFFEDGKVFLAESRIDLPPGPWPQLPAGMIMDLPVPGRLEFSGGWIILLEEIELKSELLDQVSSNQDPYQAWLDKESMDSPLLLRTRCMGDRFAPLGMGGKRVQLAEWMVNQKMPRRARDGWPLVISGEEILWVPGYRSSHTCRLTDSSQRAIHLQFFTSNQSA